MPCRRTTGSWRSTAVALHHMAVVLPPLCCAAGAGTAAAMARRAEAAACNELQDEGTADALRAADLLLPHPRSCRCGHTLPAHNGLLEQRGRRRGAGAAQAEAGFAAA